MLLRTTSTNIFDRGARASVVALHSQLHGELTLLVDTTICVSNFCDAEWIGRGLGVETWGYSADDIARQWPSVRWPVMGFADDPKPRDDQRCWLVRRLARNLGTIHKVPRWPHSKTGLHLSRSVHKRPEMGVVNYLIHEPSIILWWLAHGKTARIEHVWVLEDDTFFGGSAGSAAHFFNRFEHQSTDMVSLFCGFFQKCNSDQRRGVITAQFAGQVGKPDHYVDDERLTLHDMVHHWEHVVMFSGRLLSALDSALRSGYVMHGEYFASTFCIRHAPWCTTQDLRSVDAASGSMRDARLKLTDIRRYMNEERWFHVEPHRMCPSLMAWSSKAGLRWTASQRRIAIECAHQRPWEENQSRTFTVDLIGSRSDAQAMAPLLRLIDAQPCEHCCKEGKPWCCLNRTAWKDHAGIID